MPKAVRADRRDLRLSTPLTGTPTVDILFDDHRVWSTKLPPARRNGSRRVPWPRAMQPYLRGTTALEIRNSADGGAIAAADVDFGGGAGGDVRVAFTDAQGRWLAMNKWNRLGPSFDGDSSGVQGRLLDSAAALAAQMQEWDYPIYMVGGNLLGAMRSGALMAHDDDIDFAFYSTETDMQQITLLSFELERKLIAAGYLVVRHSHAHLEIVFLTDEGSTDYYIDIFTGWHDGGGLYNQPFALHGTLAVHDLLPVKDVEVNGVPLPAPAVPEAWLEFAYGPNWKVPDPSFVWETPRSTLRRFENGLGVFNRQRVFWEKTWQEIDTRTPDEPGEFDDADRFLSLVPPNSLVVDLGCGDGRQADHLAAAGHRVLGVEYSYEALRVARRTSTSGAEFRFLNLNDRHALLEFGLDLLERGEQPYFFARDLLHELPQLGRADLFVTLRGVLDPQTFLFATFDCTPVTRIPSNPLTWNVTVDTLRTEAWRWKLGVTVIADRRRDTSFGRRTHATALVWT